MFAFIQRRATAGVLIQRYKLNFVCFNFKMLPYFFVPAKYRAEAVGRNIATASTSSGVEAGCYGAKQFSQNYFQSFLLCSSTLLKSHAHYGPSAWQPAPHTSTPLCSISSLSSLTCFEISFHKASAQTPKVLLYIIA